MAGEIDELMDLDPLELAKDPSKLDLIIAYHRQRRAETEKGIKPKKESGPKASLEGVMNALVGVKPKAAVEVKRRV